MLFLVFFLSGGDETQVALAIVLASKQDCAVYGCTIINDYGSDTTDFLLSEDSKIQNTFEILVQMLYFLSLTILYPFVCVLQFCRKYY